MKLRKNRQNQIPRNSLSMLLLRVTIYLFCMYMYGGEVHTKKLDNICVCAARELGYTTDTTPYSIQCSLFSHPRSGHRIYIHKNNRNPTHIRATKPNKHLYIHPKHKHICEYNKPPRVWEKSKIGVAKTHILLENLLALMLV